MRDAKGRYIKRVPAVVQPAPHWADNLAAKIRATPPWVLFMWLALTAIIYAYVGKPILFIVAVVLLVRGWVWLTYRYPRTMITTSLPRCLAVGAEAAAGSRAKPQRAPCGADSAAPACPMPTQAPRPTTGHRSPA